MKIVKNDHTGRQVWEYKGTVVEQTEKAILFQARFNRKDMQFNGVLLRQDDLFLELYPFGKWFNIYEIHDKESGAVKAWYCNVTRPAKIMEDVLSYDDLALDLFVYPDGRVQVLDRDEFSAIDISEADRSGALSGLEQLETIFSGDKRFTMENYRDFI